MAFTSKNPKFDSVILDDMDADTPANPAAGSYKVIVRDGSLYVRDSSGTETTPQSFSAADNAQNYTLAASVGSSNLTIALKTQDGGDPAASDPCFFAFRSTTAATGDYTIVQATAATSIVVPSGATLGHTSGATESIFVYALNNAGTVELAVSSQLLNEGGTHTTDTIDTSSDSLTGKYSTTGRTSKAVHYLGTLTVTEATAGTWATAPSTIALFPQRGGTAMSDAEATRQGLKTYVHGGSYNNGLAPTISNASLTSVTGSAFVPYQLQDGSWRMRGGYHAAVSSSSRGGLTFAVAGITTAAYVQSMGGAVTGAIVASVEWSTSSSNCIFTHLTSLTDRYCTTFDIALASKPTWAY